MLGATADIARAGADIVGKQQAIDLARLQGITQLGTAQAGLASQYAQGVVQPFGELAGYYLGKAGGTINPAGVSAATTPTATPTRTQALQQGNIAIPNSTSDALAKLRAERAGTSGYNY